MKKHVRLSAIVMLIALGLAQVFTFLSVGVLSYDKAGVFRDNFSQSDKEYYRVHRGGHDPVDAANDELYDDLCSKFGAEMVLRYDTLPFGDVDLQTIVSQDEFVYLGQHHQKPQSDEIYITDYLLDLEESFDGLGVGDPIDFGTGSLKIRKVLDTGYKKDCDPRINQANYGYAFIAEEAHTAYLASNSQEFTGELKTVESGVQESDDRPE